MRPPRRLLPLRCPRRRLALSRTPGARIAPGLLAGLLLVVGPRAQDQGTEDPAAAARTALEAWLASDHTDQVLLDRAVGRLVDAGEAGVAVLAPVVARMAAIENPGQVEATRRKALDALFAGYGVAYLQKQVTSDMSYAGQYAVLQPLMPQIGELYLRLLFDTPQWFPENRRVFVLAPLRDLFPQAPDASTRRALREIVDDEDFEAEVLRDVGTFLLAQWGDREPVEARLQELREKTADPDEVTALRAEQAIAALHYELREYERAGRVHQRFLRRAEGSEEIILTPSDYYNAACSLALAGAQEAAMAELTKAVDLQLDPGTDQGQRLDRMLFDRDPDLRSLRGSEAFAALVRRAFPDDDGRRPR